MISKEFCVASLVLLALGGFFLGFSGSVDDAHITFWSADVLATEGNILNYNFERIEQSSALLQVLLLAMLRNISDISVVVLGHVTTILAAIAALYCTGQLARRIDVKTDRTALFLLATAPFFVYWSFGGMESPLLSLLLLLLLMVADQWLLGKRIALPVFLLSLAAQMSRPEMSLVLCVFTLLLFPLRAVLKIGVWHWKSLIIFLCIQVVCAAILAIWRWWYFGDVMPQPVSAKVGSGMILNILYGLQYAQQTWFNWYLAIPAVLVLTGVVVTMVRWREPLVVMLVLLVLVYSAFVIASGGDWMAAGRFWVPVMPLLMLLVALVLHRLCVWPVVRTALLSVILIGNVSYLWHGTAIDFNGIPLWKDTRLIAADRAEEFSFFERHAREHLHDIPTLAFVRPMMVKLLQERKVHGETEPLNIMAGQMGMVPFYLAKDSGNRVHFLDRNGITERTLTDCPVAAELIRTRNGLSAGYKWIIDNSALLERECSFVMPDVVFDIEAGWNRKNIAALEQAGYVFVYRQRGHIFDEPSNALLPLRKIGAGQFIAVSHSIWEMLGKPVPVERNF